MITVLSILRATRPSFLLLSLLMVLMAASTANYQGFEFSISLLLLVILAAVLAHVAVNLLNEYQDFNSGLDEMTDKTPYSGGSGSLPAEPTAAKSVLGAFWLSIAVLVGLGLWFISLRGWQLLPVGLIGLVLIGFYTSKITRYPWLCLIASGLAFGPIMVIGSYFVLIGEVSQLIVVLSLIPFFLVNNLLLLNQIPDLQADKKVGRFNLLMLLGTKRALRYFVGFMLMAFMSGLFAIIWFVLPLTTALPLLAFLLAIPTIKIAFNHYDNREKLMPALAMNVIINLTVPALLAIGLWLAL